MAGFLSFILVLALIAMPISLIKPGIFSKFFNATRVKNALILGAIIVVSFVGIAVTAPEPTENASEVNEFTAPTVNQPNVDTEAVKSKVEEITQAPTETPTPSPTKKFTPTATPKPTAVPTKVILPTATPTTFIYPTSAPTPQTITDSGSAWPCNCSKTCTEISSCEEAQYLLNTCGCGARDADKDGIACDSSPLNCQN